MEQSHPRYNVIAEVHAPLFESERLFIQHEQAHIQEKLAALEAKPRVLTALLPIVGEPKLQDWKDYHRALQHYADQLDEHEQEIAEGLLPLKFFVANLYDDTDRTIDVRLHVDGGTIHPTHTAPNRPRRIDGPQHAPEWKPTAPKLSTIVSGFSRSNVAIDKHSIAARFSQLDGQDSADVVNQVLYIKGNENTRFTYEISSRELPQAERGEVSTAE